VTEICKYMIGCLLLVTQMSLASQSELVDRLHQAYADVQYFEAEFIQEKHVKHLSVPLISAGKIQFAKNHGMIWEITKPIWVKTKINQQGIFKTNQFYQDKKVTDVQMKAVAGILTELLSSRLDRIESQFNVQKVEFEPNSLDWQVTLLAKSPIIKKALYALVLSGNTGETAMDRGISQIQIIDQAANKTIISLHVITLKNQPLSQDLVDVFQ